MELTDFVKNFASQFEETVADLFTAQTKFKDLEEWSSLLSLSIIAMVDEEYDVAIKGDNIRNAETIEDIFKMVEFKKSNHV